MADISFSVSARVSKGNLAHPINAANVTADMAVTGMISDTYTLSGATVQISTAQLASVGLAYIHHLDTATASTVSIGVWDGSALWPFAAPRAGEPAMVRLAAGADYRATGTSGARIRVDITEG